MYVKILNELINMDHVEVVETVLHTNAVKHIDENVKEVVTSKIIFYRDFDSADILDAVIFDGIDDADNWLKKLSEAIDAGQNLFEIEL